MRISGSKIRTLSLFSGAGGLDIGFHNAGFEIIACVEIEQSYAKTLAANVGKGRVLASDTTVHCEDIRNFDAHTYANSGIECVIGGPPCQTFSAAGRRSGGVLGTDDARGRLFESYCRILKIIKPKVFVFENVYGLPGANGGKPWADICLAFSELGYSLSSAVLDSADYGVPQHRERLIIVGHLPAKAPFIFPMPTHGPDSKSGRSLVSVHDAISDLQDPTEPYHEFDGLYGHLLRQVPEGLNYSFFTAEMGYPKPYFAWRSKFHDFLYKVDRNSPSRTIKAQPGKFTGPFHWKNRHFTIPELKRLQTFPDAYEIVGSFGVVMEQIGNSVPPRMAEVIATSVKEQLLKPAKKLAYPKRPEGFSSTFRQRQRERTHLFKKQAKEVIAERFPNVTKLRPAKGSSTSAYTVGFEGRFRKSLERNVESFDIGKSYFAVHEIRKGAALSIFVEPVLEARPSATKKKFTRELNIEISGLSKYLIDLDSLTCKASFEKMDDVFLLWNLVEAVLTRDSQFFTLIDIYGHYANRGDTVRVSASISAPRRSPLERAVEFFGGSEHCGRFLSHAFVSEALKVHPDSLPTIVAQLRAMRWDVRTKGTHSTIRQDGILCTYPFPLLSEKAQLERRASGGEGHE